MRHSTQSTATRNGFTLVELLTVITIIGILLGLVTAVAMSVMTTAKGAVIAMEINNLDQALRTYNEKFGEFPPDFCGANMFNDEKRFFAF